MQWAMLQWLADFVKLLLSPQSRNSLNPRPREIVTKLMTPFCWPLPNSPSVQSEIYLDWFPSFEIRCTGDWRYCLILLCAIFDGCCLFCQTRRSELELICLASYCNCSRFRRPGYGMMPWLSTNHSFTYQPTMSSSGFQLVRRSQQREA
jgi:hypothetical protein